MTRSGVSSRWMPMFHWLMRGGRPPLGSIQYGGLFNWPAKGTIPALNVVG